MGSVGPQLLIAPPAADVRAFDCGEAPSAAEVINAARNYTKHIAADYVVALHQTMLVEAPGYSNRVHKPDILASGVPTLLTGT